MSSNNRESRSTKNVFSRAWKALKGKQGQAAPEARMWRARRWSLSGDPQPHPGLERALGRAHRWSLGGEPQAAAKAMAIKGTQATGIPVMTITAK
ncbi:hypothetical protein NL676_016133 [Syzygium grande]|nr:hypothetical protein NL676_016133 [Syzygium grande]